MAKFINMGRNFEFRQLIYFLTRLFIMNVNVFHGATIQAKKNSVRRNFLFETVFDISTFLCVIVGIEPLSLNEPMIRIASNNRAFRVTTNEEEFTVLVMQLARLFQIPRDEREELNIEFGNVRLTVLINDIVVENIETECHGGEVLEEGETYQNLLLLLPMIATRVEELRPYEVLYPDIVRLAFQCLQYIRENNILIEDQQYVGVAESVFIVNYGLEAVEAQQFCMELLSKFQNHLFSKITEMFNHLF